MRRLGPTRQQIADEFNRAMIALPSGSRKWYSEKIGNELKGLVGLNLRKVGNEGDREQLLLFTNGCAPAIHP